MVIYSLWYTYDYNTAWTGGRRSKFVRSMSLWKHFCNYFPLKLVKTHDLDADKNYLLACHPHGIFSTSHFANFVTEGTGFSSIFPKIVPHLMVIPGGFRFPIFREYFSMGGLYKTISIKRIIIAVGAMSKIL